MIHGFMDALVFRVWGVGVLGFGFTKAASMRQRDKIVIELMTSDRRLKASRMGSK